MTDRFVNVSAACARLQFTQCGPACIAANGCDGNCCDAPTRESGCMVTIHPSEEAAIAKRGGRVVDGLLLPKPGARGCPFKQNGLCQLHDSGAKPFGCIASPFTLNAHGTLIVRNRYKLLPCYRGKGPKGPAYKVFATSLILLFGEHEAARLSAHLDAGKGDFVGVMPAAKYAMLMDNDATKRAAKDQKAAA
jgi:hypothetical protein